jgi:hypothetical protein
MMVPVVKKMALATALFVAHGGWGDVPASPQSAYCSSNGMYCVTLTRNAAFRVAEKQSGKVLWRGAGWSPFAMLSDDGNDVLLAAARIDFVRYRASHPREPLLRIFHRDGSRRNLRVNDLPEQCGLLDGRMTYWGTPLRMGRDGKTAIVASCSNKHYDLDLKTGRFTFRPIR